MKRPCRIVAFGNLDHCQLQHQPVPSLARHGEALASPCVACLAWHRPGEGDELQRQVKAHWLRSRGVPDKAPAVEGMCMLNLVRPTHTRRLRLLAKLS
ncbi:hypothetical protein CPAR01_12690 [Colletotrichum paranaense]|uniref:Uncharacterized protein n=1 Tax=Colletotrichum paranaense TaxID=1914294 RepID=A0ABQ9S7U5_9PEZI|nr:uncharacterized protein CPAR01_12690 [Colletotrichum paranaense]KAK1528132.1 hypothetical protein CPAR01_12690 [Colletotrichum paranaense]